MSLTNNFTRPAAPVLLIRELLQYYSLGDYASEDVDCTGVLNELLATNIPIYIPPGTWVHGSITVPENGQIFGSGAKSVLRTKNVNNSFAIKMSNGSSLKHLAVDGNKANQVGTDSNSVMIQSADRVRIQNVKLFNSKTDAVNVSGASTNIVLDSIEVSGYAGSGVRISQGKNISLLDSNIYSSDPVASGNALSLISNGNPISNVNVDNLELKDNLHNGVSIIGSGSRNVKNIILTGLRASGNALGMYITSAQDIIMSGGFIETSAEDGIRLEGDVQRVRVVSMIANDNVGFGIREVEVLVAPNFNGFIYNLTSGNGNNTVTKVGAQSFIV